MSVLHEVIYDLHCTAARVNGVQRELLAKILRCDQGRAWIEDDCRDIVHWVALQLGVSLWKARRWVNCARKLPKLPNIEQSFVQGDLSLDKLVELTRFATPETERALCRWGQEVAVSTIRDRADYEIRIAEQSVREADRERSLKWYYEADNTRLALHGSFPAIDGARIVKAIDRLAEKMATSPVDERAHDDANYEDDENPTIEMRRADALACLASTVISEDADSDRATVVVHAELSALVGNDGNALLDGSIPLHPSVTKRVLCDCRYQPVLHSDDGLVIGIGKTSRLIPRWLRRQVEHRDHHRCTFPNCGSKAFLQCHHVVPWPHGPTDIDNLTLLCFVHHKLVHDHGWHVTLAPDQTTRWFRPGWRPYSPRPAPLAGIAGLDQPELEVEQQTCVGILEVDAEHLDETAQAITERVGVHAQAPRGDGHVPERRQVGPKSLEVHGSLRTIVGGDALDRTPSQI